MVLCFLCAWGPEDISYEKGFPPLEDGQSLSFLCFFCFMTAHLFHDGGKGRKEFSSKRKSRRSLWFLSLYWRRDPLQEDRTLFHRSLSLSILCLTGCMVSLSCSPARDIEIRQRLERQEFSTRGGQSFFVVWKPPRDR